MRAVGSAYMSKRQKAILVEPQTLQEARQTMHAAKVQKFFPANDDFAGGTFNGVVEGVDGKIAQEDGSILSGVFYRIRYEDGDGEHLQWADLKKILLSLPAKGDAEAVVTPAVAAKPKRAAAKQGSAEGDTAKKQKLSPAEDARIASPEEPLTDKGNSVDGPLPTATKGTRSKRHRAVKSWAHILENNENDENDAQAANTPTVPPTTNKKLRIAAPTPFGSKCSGKPPLAKSTVKKEFSKSAVKKEIKPFPLEERLPEDGSPGQLQKVKLVNFMCHEHFEMDFCPHINFVSGTNGSGKSAVLQAIQQVLGVRASATNRASTQKEFIRKGATEAVISVTLWNKGEDSYQPEKWGSFITIDRRIGNSCSWSLKDAQGRKREDTRSQLDGILDALNLNGANPIAVMTQDITRSFLAGSNEKSDRKKFDIYMEATLLAQSQENYQIAKADLQKIAESISQAQGVYKQLKDQRQQLSAAVEALKLMSEWQDEESQMMSGLAWATVGEMEPKLQHLDKLIEQTIPNKLQKIEACLGPAQQKLEESQKLYVDQRTAMGDFNTNFMDIANETKRLQKEHTNARSALREEQRKVDQIKAEMTELDVSKEEFLSSMKETQQSQDFMATQAAADQLQAQLTQQQQTCEAAAADEQVKEQAHKDAFERLKAASAAVDEASDNVRNLQREVEHVQATVNNLRHSVKDRLHLFGGDAAIRLRKAIHREAKNFHQIPVGPLGELLSLTDDRWGYVVANHLGFLQYNYVVHDHDDYKLLRRLCNGAGFKKMPTIIISNFSVPQHVIPAAKRLPDGVSSLAGVLRCSNKKCGHIVINGLIDGVHAERAALCHNPDEARHVAAHRQVLFAYMDDGAKFEQRGSTSTYLPGMNNPRVLIGADVPGQIQQQEDYLVEKHAELAEAKLARQKLATHHQECSRSVTDTKRAKRTAQDCRSQAESQYHDLLSQSQTQLPAEGADEGEIERELRTLNERVIEAQQQLMEAQSACGRAQEAEAEAHSIWEAKRQEGEKLDNDNSRMTSEVEQHRTAVEEAQAQLQYYQQHQQETSQKLDALKGKHEEAKRLLVSNTEKAEKVCSREEGEGALQSVMQKALDKGATEDVAKQQTAPEALTQALGKLRAKMTNQEKENGGKSEDVLLKHAEIQSQCKEHRDRLQRLQNTYYLLNTACEKRMSDLSRIDKALEESVNLRFNYYMFKKGHTGMIKVKRATEEKPGTLEIKVRIGGNGSKSGNVKDLKQLSGGEKSYTTVAFALALGEWTQSPFRAMDEFDVFMDAINRRVAMENLFSNSLEHPDLQFIFLTPQDINAVEEAKKNLAARGTPLPEDYCKVVQMRAART